MLKSLKRPIDAAKNEMEQCRKKVKKAEKWARIDPQPLFSSIL